MCVFSDSFWLYGPQIDLFRFFPQSHRAADICASNLAIRRNRAI